MGIEKVALNFIVKNSNGELVKSVLCHKPPKMSINMEYLRYNPSQNSHISKFSTVLNIKTGKQEQIDITDITLMNKIPKDGRHFDFSAYNSLGEKIGLVRLSDDPNNNMLRILGEKEDNLYIEYWATSPGYKGVGTKMLEEIVKLSNRSGYNGRVSLSACTGSIPPEFMDVCKYKKTQDISCAIKYHKMGFRATTPKEEAKIQNAILNGTSGLEYRKNGFSGYSDTLSCKMELSPETIKKYLHYNSII